MGLETDGLRPAGTADGGEPEAPSGAAGALAESEARYRLLASATFEGITVHEDGRHIDVNDAFASMLGYTREELIGTTVSQLAAPESQALILEHVRSGSEEPYEVVGIRKDGTRIDLEVRGRTLQIGERRLRAAALRDITQQRRAAAALRESEARYRTLVEDSRDAIYTTRPDGTIEDLNRAGVRLLGLRSREEAIGQDARQFYADPAQREPGVRRLAERGVLDDFEFVLRRADGELRTVLETATAVRDTDGRVLAHRGILHDITERKRAEERLRVLAAVGAELAAALEDDRPLARVAEATVLAGVADACLLWRLDEGGHLERVAAQLRAGAAATEAEATGLERAGLDALAGHVAGRGTPLLVPALRRPAGRSSRRVQSALSSLSELGYPSAILVPLRVRGRVLGVLALLAGERSRRYDAEDLAFARELAGRCALALDNARLYRAAQDAIAERDAFLIVAAHELKTPMTSVRAYAQLLDRSIRSAGADADPVITQRALGMIDQQTAKLDRLVRRLLDVSRLQAGQLSLDLRPIDLSALVTDVVAAAALRAPRRTFALDAPPRCEITADDLQLEQVLTNLLDNAIKYSPPDSPIDVLLRDDPDDVELVIRDDGPGVPPDRRERLFERFYRAHGDSHASGLGVGLFVSRQIVALHGGEIRAEFPEDGGARFVVRIPRSREQAAALKRA